MVWSMNGHLDVFGGNYKLLRLYDFSMVNYWLGVKAGIMVS